jgi:decaprenylphospho-beta-D-ribofuranose 2-oxidase
VETRASVAVQIHAVPGTPHHSLQAGSELGRDGATDAVPSVERTVFRSLDRNESIESVAVRPDSYDAAASALAASPHAIPRGQGLSYCLASAGEGSTSILTAGFDRLLRFDPDTCTVEVEAGFTLGALAGFALSKGLWFPVLPGYPTITVGGALAMNVHGKSQHHEGLFADHVVDLHLLHPRHGEIRCSRAFRSDVLELTLGGMGLTGLVTRATLRLQPLKGRSLSRSRVVTGNLRETFEVMVAERDHHDQVYSWVDLNRSKGDFGSGFVYLESFVPEATEVPFRTGGLRADAARWPWPGWTLRLINHAYRLMERGRPSTQRFDPIGGSFPLNGKEIYFAACGSRGFHESQVLIPFAAWRDFAAALGPLLRRHGVFTTLGSLKLFRGPRRLLNFCGDGVCIAIDIPRQARSAAFLSDLDALMLEAGGIPNISKDSRLSRRVVEAAYPAYVEFKERLRAFDPDRRMQSALRTRLDV